jgi:PEP-CTERM motif-containing protein
MRTKYALVVLTMVMMAVVFTAAKASANLVLTVTDSNGGQTSGSIVDADNDGSVSFSGVVGNFNVVVTVGISDPASGGSKALPLMDIVLAATADANTTGADSLVISLTDTDFIGTGNIAFASQLTATNLTGALSLSSWLGPNNTEFELGDFICTVTLPGATTCSGVGINPSGLYSLTMTETWTPGHAASLLSSDGNLQRVPEPAAMLLFGLGLVGLGVWGRKRLVK